MTAHIAAGKSDLKTSAGTPCIRETKSHFHVRARTRWSTALYLRTLIAIIGIGTCFTDTANAKKLRHKATGFRAVAPSGFRLKASNGIYSIKKGKDVVTMMKVSSPLNGKGVAQSLANTARMKRPRFKGGGNKTVLTGNIGKKSAYIEVLGTGPIFTVKKYVTKTKKRAKQAKVLTPLTLRDIALLRRIGGSARGGIVSPFQVDIPMQRFTSGGASALVPNIPGWTFNGVGGAIEGSLPGQGLFALGIAFPGVATSLDPGQVIVNDWSRMVGLAINFAPGSIQFIPGTAGVLGPPPLGATIFNSATFTMRFTLNGVVYDGIMTSGVTNVSGVGTGLDWYFSFIAVRTGAFPGLGNALSQTWATWDASANRASRLASTIATIRSTPTVAINRDAFDRIHSAWVEFIRM